MESRQVIPYICRSLSYNVEYYLDRLIRGLRIGEASANWRWEASLGLSVGARRGLFSADPPEEGG